MTVRYMPFQLAEDQTQPLKVPVRLQGARTCRPALTRVTGPGLGQTFPIPDDARRAGLLLGRGPEAGLRLADETVSREHARIFVRADGAVVVADLGSTNGTLVNGRRVQSAVLSEGDKIQVGAAAVFRFALNDRLDEDYLAHLYETSIRDPLTGLFNRRYLMETLERDLALGRRHGLPTALVLIDVDDFKAVNDGFGHAGGDAVLRQLADLLAGMQRQESLLARYGGEEFAVLLRNVDPVGVEVFAERMRQAVERARVPVAGGKVRLTISLGVAVSTEDGAVDPQGLVDQADRYLYLSKSRGRNCSTSARTFSA